MTPPRSSQLLVAEGLARQGSTAQAVEACYEALRKGDGGPFPHCLLSELLLAEDFYDEAISEATAAIEADPDCAPAYLNLGLAYDRRGGMWDRSVLVWHELAEVVPDLTTAHVQLGEAFAASNFTEEAIDAWKRALQLDPNEARAMYDLAVAALKREGVATALPGFRRAGELDPSQDELFFNLLGIETLDRGPAEPGSAMAERGAKLGEAGALARLDDMFGALELVRGVLDDAPDEHEALTLAAYIYYKQEADNEAMACALHALSLAPETRPALYVLGTVYARRRGLDRHAARAFQALVEAAPRHPMPHVLFGECLLGLQRYDKAKEAYRRAVGLDPACVRARFGLAAVYLTEGRHAEAAWEVGRAAYYDTRRQGLFWKLYDGYAEGVS